MAGRPKQKVYVYSSEGIPVEKFESCADFCRAKGFPTNYLSEMGIFTSGVVRFSDDQCVCTSRIGRSAVKLFFRKKECKYIPNRKLTETKQIECYNLDNELIATFKSKFYLDAFLGTGTVLATKQHGPNGLLFKQI